MLLSSARSRASHSLNLNNKMGFLEMSNGSSSSEINKIAPNTLYLTFNAPQKDDYHRSLFLTYPPVLCVPEPMTSGMLFHATYAKDKWELDKRHIHDLSTSKSLCLLYRLHTVDPATHGDLTKTYNRMAEVIEKVPVGRQARESQYGEVRLGNPALDGYDCVIWTGDVMRALVKEGLIDLQGRDPDDVMAHARSLAGPEDATSMVNKDFGGLKIIM